MNGIAVYNVAIIGAGAAGCMAAGLIADRGLSVALIDKNARCGAKVRITGKGRCNLTNDCTNEKFLSEVVSNGRFLYAAAANFSPADCMAFFRSLGVELKTERGGRVFPASDNANEVADALERFCSAADRISAQVTAVRRGDFGFELDCGQCVIRAQKLLIATGGMSYPKTGSTGDGYEFAKSLGLKITPPRPSLIPLCCDKNLCSSLMGLSLRNVTLSLMLEGQKKPLYSELGELLFTHFGLSGPLVLSASAHLGDAEVAKRGALQGLFDGGKLWVSIDLKPALTHQQLDARILRDFSENLNRDFRNSLGALLPSKLIGTVVRLSGIPGQTKVNSVTSAQRAALVNLLKDFRLTLRGLRPIDEAIVTAGGVEVTQINPSTMQAKEVEGLYFAGEVLDLDAYTGGYNLQIAFSTAALAAKNIIAERDR